jgi:hypothetical protein
VAHSFVVHLPIVPRRILLLQIFLFYFSLPVQEVLPLTNLLSPQEKSLNLPSDRGKFTLSTLKPPLSSPLMHLPSFIYSNPREVSGRRCFGFLVIPGLKEIANMER